LIRKLFSELTFCFSPSSFNNEKRLISQKVGKIREMWLDKKANATFDEDILAFFT
jgi:hypothetical protein